MTSLHDFSPAASTVPAQTAAAPRPGPGTPRTAPATPRTASAAHPVHLTSGSAARGDVLYRIVAEVLDSARPRLASSVGLARVALDELRAMAACAELPPASAPATDLVERLARTAALPEIRDHDFRRDNGQGMTVREREAWERVKRFASLIAAAVTARDCGVTATRPARPAPARSMLLDRRQHESE